MPETGYSSAAAATIPVRLLAEYLVCPAQAWLRLRGPPVSWNTDHWRPGEAAHPPPDEIRRVAEEILGPGPEILFNPLLHAPRLRVTGRPDAIATKPGHKPLVVEYKERTPRDPKPWVLQAALYKLAADEALATETQAVLATPDETIHVAPRHVAGALRLLHQVRRALAKPLPPRPRRPPPCRSCNYRRICPYARPL